MSDPKGAERPTPVRTKHECLDAVVKELNLDTSDPFTLLFANACALVDQRDALKEEIDRMRELSFPYSDALGFAREARATIGHHVKSQQDAQDEIRRLKSELLTAGQPVNERIADLERDRDDLRERVKEVERELADWNELFLAVTLAGLPKEYATVAQIKSIWPNEWHQDCAATAFAIKRMMERLATLSEAAKRLAVGFRALQQIMPNVRQLIDGFMTDPAWNQEWDKQTRDSLIDWNVKYNEQGDAACAAIERMGEG